MESLSLEKTYSSEKTRKNGGEGHRSPYLSHAKRALYHLSYTPYNETLRISILIPTITFPNSTLKYISTTTRE